MSWIPVTNIIRDMVFCGVTINLVTVITLCIDECGQYAECREVDHLKTKLECGLKTAVCFEELPPA